MLTIFERNKNKYAWKVDNNSNSFLNVSRHIQVLWNFDTISYRMQ